MKNKIFGLFVLAIFSLSMVTGAFAQEIHAFSPDKGEDQFSVTLNESFLIMLESNPSTGYKWECEYDPEYLQLIDDTYFPRDPKLIGSGGIQIYQFKAIKTGETQMLWEYQRPWESLPAKNIPCYVTINE